MFKDTNPERCLVCLERDLVDPGAQKYFWEERAEQGQSWMFLKYTGVTK